MSNHKKIDWLRWHKRKQFIRINCAILMSILLIILLLMFPIVSDASTFYIKDKYFCNSFYDVSTGKSTYYQVTNDYFWEWAISSNPNDYFDSVKDLFDCQFDDRGVSLSSYLIVADKNDTDKLHFFTTPFGLYFYKYADGSYSIALQYNSIDDYIYSISDKSFSFSQYNGSNVNSFFGGIITGSAPINFIQYNGNGGTDFSVNVNYLASENLCGFADGTNSGFNVEPPSPTVYPDGSGGTDANNLYMRTADWKFNIPQYWPSVTSTLVQPAYTNRWGEGSISFYGLLNDYQKANASNFNLKFNFQIVCNGHFFSDTQSSVNGTFVGSFHYDNFTVPLSTFISNNNYATFSVSNLFTNATNGLNQTFASYLDNIKGHNSIDRWQWYIICDACLVSNGSESGHCKEKYDFISQVSKETDYSITDNTDPFYPDDYDPTNQPDDSKEDENAKIINNNNDIININNNDKAVIDRLYDKLVPPDTVGEGGLTERFVNLTNANAWFEIMENQLTIFPAEFWTTIYTIFLASLGILGGAFLLWILAHIL